MKDLRVKDVMISHVVSVNENDTLSHVEELIRVNKIRHVPVVDTKKRLVGMVTQRDILRCVHPRKTEDGYIYAKEDLDEFILKFVMIKEPTSVHAEDPLVKVIEIMAREKYGAIPVVDDHRLLTGIISQIDILRLLYKAMSDDGSGSSPPGASPS